MPEMIVTAVYTMTNNKKQRTMNYSKQTQTKPNLNEWLRPNLTNHGNTSLAQIRMAAVGANAWPIVPASLAFLMSALLCRDRRFNSAFFQFDLTNDAKGREIFQAELFDNSGGVSIAADSHSRFLIAADDFVPP
jgi:hypothetical protein